MLQPLGRRGDAGADRHPMQGDMRSIRPWTSRMSGRMTLRDVGLAVAHTIPWIEDLGRWIYVRLPAFLHDTPTSRLSAHVAGRHAVTFIQIGAFDGVSGDPLRRLVLANTGWSGVMIEPQADAFERLQKNYAAQSQRLIFLNLAISDAAGERTLFYISDAERASLGLPDWASEIPSFNPAHLAKHFPQARPTTHRVRTATFAEVAELLPAAKVDVVVVDTEGHERIILDTIDLDRHGVQAILYEHTHLSAGDAAAVEGRLRTHGFALKRFHRDTIACRTLPSAGNGTDRAPAGV